MNLLNLRDDPPPGDAPEAPDAMDDERAPDEPPGLAAIRAWLRKPRPRLRGARLWVVWIGARFGKGGRWVWVRRGPVVRGARTTVTWTADSARWAARVLQSFANATQRLAGAVGEPAADERLNERLVPRLRRAAAALGDLVEEPGAGDRIPGAGDDEPSARTSVRSGESHAATAKAKRPSGRDAARAARGASDHPPSHAAPPRAEPVKESAASPARRERERRRYAAYAARQARAEERRADPELQEFRFDLYGRLAALGRRPGREVLRPLIVDVLAERGWTTPATLARWLGLGAANLTRRHLSPMVAAGALERRHPKRVNHPEQAYRVKSAAPDAQ